MTAWVLLIYVGLHQGSVVIPGIKSQDACIALYRQIAVLPEYRWHKNNDVHCIPYEIAE